MRGSWAEIPVESISVKLDPERGPVRMKISFTDGTRRVIAIDPEQDVPPVLEELLCDKACSPLKSVPCWWG